MFNSIVLDVVIGLVLIYLLYSLLATILSELIATVLGLRARNLKEAVDWMLNDAIKNGWWGRLLDSLKLTKNPTNPITEEFYNHPEIKYLGSSGIFRKPSNFSSASFTRALLNILFGDAPLTNENIDNEIDRIVKNSTVNNEKDKSVKILDEETAKYLKMLWEESGHDLEAFRLQLQGWFDRTMENATEWYKRKIQVVLLILGFFLAWVFCADTFSIIGRLSKDKDAREQMVSMANAYVENNKTIIDRAAIKDSSEMMSFSQKLDSLLEIKKQLDADIANANNILGIGSWLPDVVKVVADPITKKKTYFPVIDEASVSKKKMADDKGNLTFSTSEKWAYFFRLVCHHFFGFLITAIAISLGAPFWFDLLNKLVKLRTSKKEEPVSASQ
jgi:hypothetical protein